MTGIVPGLAPWVRPGRVDVERPFSGRSRLPIPQLRSDQPPSGVYSVVSMDCNGRVADRALVLAMGWPVGLALDVRVQSDLIVLRPDPLGRVKLFGPGYIRLPSEVRHRCDLVTGSRLLLVGEPDLGVAMIYPPAVLGRMVSAFHASAFGAGEAP